MGALNALRRAGDQVLEFGRRLYRQRAPLKLAFTLALGLSFVGLRLAAGPLGEDSSDLGFLVASGAGLLFGPAYGILGAVLVVAADAGLGAPGDETLHIVMLVILGAVSGGARETTEQLIAGRAALVRAETAARKRAQRLSAVIDAARVFLFAVDRDGTFLVGEGTVLGLPGPGRDRYVGRSAFEVYREVYPAQAASLSANLRRALAGEGHTARLSIEGRALEVRYVPVRAPDGSVAEVIGVGGDVTDFEDVRRDAALGREQLAAMIDSSPVILFAIDRDGRFTLSEGRGLEALGLRPGEAVGASVYEMFADVPPALDAVRRAIAGEEVSVVLDMRGLAYEAKYVPTRAADGSPSGLIGVAVDVTERAQAGKELERLAHFDTLTGLPNRSLLKDELARIVATGTAPVALLLIDLDRFRELNDTLGHGFGDAVLREVGARLRAGASPADVVARFGNDEFALVVPGRGADHAAAVGAAVLATLSRSLNVGGQPIDLTASIGIALAPAHGTDPDTLFRRADAALAVAKRTGLATVLFSPELDHSSSERIALVAELRDAIAAGALALHYQPIVRTLDRRVAGVEALARWVHPTRGPVPPDEFVQLAERTGLVRQLTEWALAEAFRQHLAWRTGGRSIEIAVNVSVRNLADPGFVEQVEALMREHGFAECPLRLEITETAIMTHPDRALVTLSRLRAIGVRLSIDDFGIGYSSLAYLNRLPADTMKIDRSFVGTLLTDASSRSIVHSVIELGRALGLDVVAEGVEDEATAAALVGLGCGSLQGYAICRPAPASEIERWLNARETVAR